MRLLLAPPGAGLMNTVINYASGKPSDPLRGYIVLCTIRIEDIPIQIAGTVHKMLSVTTVIAYGRLYLTVTGPQDFPSHPLQTDTK